MCAMTHLYVRHDLLSEPLYLRAFVSISWSESVRLCVYVVVYVIMCVCWSVDYDTTPACESLSLGAFLCVL